MMRCDSYREMLELLRDGVLPPETASAMRAHGARCEACRAFESESRELTGVLAGFPDGPYLPPGATPFGDDGPSPQPRAPGRGPGGGGWKILLALIVVGSLVAALRGRIPGGDATLEPAGVDTASRFPGGARGAGETVPGHGTGTPEDRGGRPSPSEPPAPPADGTALPSSALIGRVVSWPSGRGVEGVRIEIGEVDARTDTFGLWRIDGVPPVSSATATFTPPVGPAFTVLLPGVEPQRTLLLDDFAIGPAASLRVRVLDDSGAPVGGARVEGHLRLHGAQGIGSEEFHLDRGEGPSPCAEAVTSPDGEAILRNLPPGAVLVRATAPGFAFSDPVSVLPWPGEPAPGPDIEIPLERGHHVRGRVVDHRGEAVVGGAVRAQPGGRLSSFRDPLFLVECVTDGNGGFDLGPLPDRPLLLRGSSTGGVLSGSALVRPSAAGPVLLTVPREAPFARRVVDADTGAPAVGAVVRVDTTAGPEPLPGRTFAVVDAAGFLRAPEGTTGSVSFHPTPGTPWRLSGDAPDPVRTRDPFNAGPVPEETLRLRRPPAITVDVVDEAGAPAPGATVVLYHERFAQRAAGIPRHLPRMVTRILAIADSTGRAVVHGVPRLPLVVCAWPAELGRVAPDDGIDAVGLLNGDVPDRMGLLDSGASIEGPRRIRRTLMPTRVLKGVLVDGDGKPVQARFGPPGRSPQAARATAADGTFSVTVPDATPLDPSLPVLMRGGARRLARPVADDRWVIDDADAGRPVEGVAVDENGQPVPGVRLAWTASRAPRGSVPAGIVSRRELPLAVRNDGSFRMHSGAVATLAANERSPGHLVAEAPGYVTAEASLASPGPEGVRLVLRRGHRIAVRLVDAAGAPLAGRGVAPQMESHGLWRSIPWAALSDADGRVELDGLPGPPSTLLVGDPSFPGSIPAAVPVPPDAVLVPGSARASGRPDIVVPSRFTLTGRVLDADRAPVPGARVTPVDERSKSPWGVAHTDPDGRFRIEGVAMGPTLVRVMPTRTSPEHVRSTTRTFDFSTEAPVEIVLDTGITLHGHVHRTDGLPPGRGWVSAESDPQSMVQAPVEEDGRFTLRGLTPGPWTLKVDCAGGTASLSLSADTRGPIEVPLRSDETAPVRQVTVRVRAPSTSGGGRHLEAFVYGSLAAGQATSTPIEPDIDHRWTVEEGRDAVVAVRSDDGRCAFADLPPSGAVTVELDVDDVHRPGLRGTVLLPGGAPAAGIPVEARLVPGVDAMAPDLPHFAADPSAPPLQRDIRRTVTDSAGRFHLGNPAGRWRVVAGTLPGAVVPAGWCESVHPHGETLAPPVQSGAPLEVHLLDEGGQPCNANRIRIEPGETPGSPHPHRWSVEVQPEKDGHLLVPGLPPGTLRLTEVGPGVTPLSWVVPGQDRDGPGVRLRPE